MLKPRPLSRPRFFDGRLLTAEDLTQEQDYVIGKLKRHNRSLHGFGVVSGLRVTLLTGKILVEAGLALDCEGNEIAIEAPQTLAPLSTGDARISYVNIRYAEDLSNPLPDMHGEGDAGSQCATISEGFEVSLGLENFTRGHRHLRARWLTCGQPHPLTIAKLSRSLHGWRVSRRYRAPSVK